MSHSDYPTQTHAQTAGTSRALFHWHNLLVGMLLLLIIVVGGYFRFVGQNWDDFAGLHPDERFLTVNLLPLLGGGLEFTPDPEAFPDHVLIVEQTETDIVSRYDLERDLSVRVGVLADTQAYDVVGWWLGESRAVEYDTPEDMVRDIQSGAIRAIVMEMAAGRALAGDATLPDLSSGYSSVIRETDTIPSVDIQRTRCLVLNPETAGAGGYFDTLCSPLNPHNANAGFYAYGTLPLFMAHFTGEFVRAQEMAGIAPFNFETGTLIWRFLSAFFDVGSIILIFIAGSRMHNKWVGLLAAVLYAAVPLAIQKAHYGTVNSITAFWVMLAIVAALGVQDRGRYFYYALFGFATGAAVSGRINTAPLAGLVVLATIVHVAPILDRRLPLIERQRIATRALAGLILSGVVAFLTFRVFNPYAFQGPGFFGILPDHRWLADLGSGQFGVSGASDGPPNWQWMGRPSYVYPLKDMFLWGMGIAAGVMAWAGWAWAGYRLLRARKRSLRNILVFTWVLVYFAWMGRLWVMTMRYYLPLYGALMLLAAWALYELWRQTRSRRADLLLTQLLLLLFALITGTLPLYYLVNGDMTTTASVAGGLSLLLAVIALLPLFNRQRVTVLIAFVVGFTLLWGTMFTNIYRNQVTRIQGATWLWENVPGDFAMRIEGAPDDTPLINIALPNMPVINGVQSPETLLENATTHFEGQPKFAEFIAPATGTINAIHAPHLGEMGTTDEAESLTISVSVPGATAPLAIATLTTDMKRDQHILGNAYDIPFDVPLQVEAGQQYTIKIESLKGDIVGGGSVVLTEGPWDDRLTSIKFCQLPQGMTLADNPPPGLAGYDTCQGREAWSSLVQSYDLAMSYPVDEDIKLESIVNGLHNGDYLAITSNRFYDTLTRNRLRWPMSSRYYEALFAGELGYEPVAVFDEHFELGPLSVSDQHLPVYDSPDWFNEFEADEAFHVYDHPVVYIFKKSPDYDPEQVEFILNSVPLKRTNQIFADVNPIGAQLVGVVYQDSLTASQAPTGLYLTPDMQAIQAEGGTWSERFDSDSVLNVYQPAGVIVWWLLIIVFGAIVFPLLFVLFPGMADRGYGFAKFTGLMLVAFIAWFFSSLKVPLWSQAGVLLVMLMVAAFSLALSWRHRRELLTFLRERWQMIVWIEVLSLLLFLFFIGVRLTNPDLWHQSKGGEKPMDFAYFNAVLRSTIFPPYDPWHAGGYMNYYYFGFVLVGSPVLVLKLVPAFAYNLIIPTVFSITGLGAFSVAFNIVASWKRRDDVRMFDGLKLTPRPGNPWVAGIMALVLCVFLGNLDTIRVLGNGIAQLGGYRTPIGIESFLIEQYTVENGESPGPEATLEIAERVRAGYITDRIGYELDNAISLVRGLGNGLGRALGGELLPIGSDRWYWGPTRVLAETPGVEGNAITEMPYFSFLYGDLHAHMINFPVMLFVLFFLFNELTLVGRDRRSTLEAVLSLAVGALMVGMIRAINTWDWPAFLLLSVVGLGYVWWLRWRVLNRWSLTHLLLYVGGFISLSFLFALPYSTWYAAIYNSINPWEGGKTPIWAYLDIHGLFLFLILGLLLWETGRWLRSVKVRALKGRGSLLVLAILVGIIILLFLLGLSLMSYQVVLIAVPMILWIIPLFFRSGQTRAMQFVLVMIGFALALTVGVEFIVVAGDIARQNTVFKFYLQVWMLFSVAGGVVFAWLLQSTDYWRNWLRFLWFVPLVVLISIAGMYPLMATRGRALDRMAPETPLTLNGLDYMQYADHVLMDYGEVIELKDDYAIIRWLQEHVEGTPVIMEGRSLASEYRWNGRIAINTGLPAVLGWNFHQRQQRTFEPFPGLVQQREANIKFFYDTDNIALAVRILRHYDVAYVILGTMEVSMISDAGLDKFRIMRSMGLVDVVFESGRGTVLKVNHDMLDEFARSQPE